MYVFSLSYSKEFTETCSLFLEFSFLMSMALSKKMLAWKKNIFIWKKKNVLNEKYFKKKIRHEINRKESKNSIYPRF